MRLVVVALLLALTVTLAGRDGAAAPNRRDALLARLAEDPADPGALLGLATVHERAGRKHHARRYLRAFVRLVHRHPDRPEAARRLAALRPEHAFVLEDDRTGKGAFATYRNVIDRALAVRVPEGPYRRHLRFDGAEVTVDVTLPDYLIDLHEATVGSWHWFLWEGSYGVRGYWDEAGWKWQRDPESDRVRWRFLFGRTFRPHHPRWGETYHEASARARWAGKRVPTEAEWEKAARGGIHLDGTDGKRENPHPDRLYPWGDAPPEGPDGSYRANIDSVIPRQSGNDEDGTVAADTMPEGASPYGCRHMAGNVTEWNADRWVDDAARFRLPRVSPFAKRPTDGRHDAEVRTVRGGYFKTCWRTARIDTRDRRTFWSANMTILFKAGLRCAADAPPAKPADVGPLADEPDPLDVKRLYRIGKAAEDEGDRARAYRFYRAALRLVRHGALRARLVEDTNRVRPENPWVEMEDGRLRNLIDGKVAVRAGGLTVDVFEVTEGDWMRFAAEGGYETRELWTDEGWRNRQWTIPVNIARFGTGDLPATGVSIHDARAYSRWARKRLPTLEEWRRLAGRGERRYPWGDERPTAAEPRCACEETGEHDHPGHLPDRRVVVGSFPTGATPEGVHDLAGSVQEWVENARGDDRTLPGSVGGDVWSLRREIHEDLLEGVDEQGGRFSGNCENGFRCVAR